MWDNTVFADNAAQHRKSMKDNSTGIAFTLLMEYLILA